MNISRFPLRNRQPDTDSASVPPSPLPQPSSFNPSITSPSSSLSTPSPSLTLPSPSFLSTSTSQPSPSADLLRSVIGELRTVNAPGNRRSELQTSNSNHPVHTERSVVPVRPLSHNSMRQPSLPPPPPVSRKPFVVEVRRQSNPVTSSTSVRRSLPPLPSENGDANQIEQLATISENSNNVATSFTPISSIQLPPKSRTLERDAAQTIQTTSSENSSVTPPISIASSTINPLQLPPKTRTLERPLTVCLFADIPSSCAVINYDRGIRIARSTYTREVDS